MFPSSLIAASCVICVCFISFLALQGLKLFLQRSEFFRERRLTRKLARFNPQHSNEKFMVDSPIGREFGGKSR